ncbi:MAG: 16S rRNA (uracil(1498)-N(3))-methyltransferase [Deltaproteobacteria bacterium]|jgi:16S rRNA (uracil1498-N3)-methyltransferase|nr:16S rRNA (uracil(1498)-N(3))-methyltransferase [Deltaproteobacteria bacterium]
MQIHRFYLSPQDFDFNQGPISEGTEFTLPPTEARYGVLVLRLKKGSQIVLSCHLGSAKGLVIEATMTPKPILKARLLAPFSLKVPQNAPILALSLLRPGPFDWAVEKAVELGCGNLVPLIAKRTRTQDLDALGKDKKLARWQKIMQSALKQSERDNLMEISEPLPLEGFLSSLEPIKIDEPSILIGSKPLEAPRINPNPRLLLDPNGVPFPKELSGTPLLLVGPEGGFSQEEKEDIKAKGFIGVSLGPFILRSETCALAALTASLLAQTP